VTEGDILTKAAHSASPFDSQLYVFEAAGTLISILNQIPDQQKALLEVCFILFIFPVKVQWLNVSIRRSSRLCWMEYAGVFGLASRLSPILTQYCNSTI
jgi:hypothetical protein